MVLLAASAGVGSIANAQTGPKPPYPSWLPIPEEFVKRLPADWQEAVRKWATDPPSDFARFSKMKDDELLGEMYMALGRAEGAEDFVLDHLRDPTVPAVTRNFVMQLIGFMPRWANNARAGSVLREMVTSEPDEVLAEVALDEARKRDLRGLRAALDERMAAHQNDPELIAKLQKLDERWVSLVNGTMLPAFMQRVPPIFEVKHASPKIRVLAFGDFGVTNATKEWRPQGKVAAAMLEYSRTHPYDFGITLGDNFYTTGLDSPDHPRWQKDWEDFYGPLKIPFYVSLGNHDWFGPDSPAAEIMHTALSTNWHLPSTYYTFTSGPVQFFAIDSNEIPEAQATWLKDALEKSRAKWKIVYGHHPPYFTGDIGITEQENLVKILMPVLKGRADVYIAGHMHNLQHLKPVDGVNLFIAGGGGASSYEVDEKSPVAIFAKKTAGFAVLEMDEHNFTLHFIDADGKEIYKASLQK